MFQNLTAFLSDLKVRWSDWRTGRITDIEEALDDPEKFVRQVLRDTKRGALRWSSGGGWSCAHQAALHDFGGGQYLLFRVDGKTFGFESAVVFYELRVAVRERGEIYFSRHTKWYCGHHIGKDQEWAGNMKIYELCNAIMGQWR